MRLLLLLMALLIGSCTAQHDRYNLIPYPNHLVEKQGEFTIDASTKIIIPADSAVREAVSLFADRLSAFLPAPIEVIIGAPAVGTMSFLYDYTLPNEGYLLNVNDDRIDVRASSKAGFFYATQTLSQLLPADFLTQSTPRAIKLKVPCVEIRDYPRFAYRGAMFDVGRYFYSVADVKKFVDIMAFHKLNKFHWHLTDDQGWRIEIDKYPRLIEIGSQRRGTEIGKDTKLINDIAHGGFYTKAEIREVVEYARRRSITVIPEVDMPGHMMAALASYNELGCTRGPYETLCYWDVNDDILCAGRESTYQFVEGVLDEVIELFPSEYIHIGGDEAPKVRWRVCTDCQRKIKDLGFVSDTLHSAEEYLQSYFIHRVGKMLDDRGRKMIGWDEILEGGAPANSTIMSWRGEKGGIAAAKSGLDVIMSPTSHLYLDYYQATDIGKEPLAMGGYVPVDSVYNYDPIPAELTPEQQKHILGAQGNMWTELISDMNHLEYMLLPRLTALSEVQWCSPHTKSLQRFASALPGIYRRYELMGYNYANHPMR